MSQRVEDLGGGLRGGSGAIWITFQREMISPALNCVQDHVLDGTKSGVITSTRPPGLDTAY